jgi:hypothetical protein
LTILKRSDFASYATYSDSVRTELSLKLTTKSSIAFMVNDES